MVKRSFGKHPYRQALVVSVNPNVLQKLCALSRISSNLSRHPLDPDPDDILPESSAFLSALCHYELALFHILSRFANHLTGLSSWHSSFFHKHCDFASLRMQDSYASLGPSRFSFDQFYPTERQQSGSLFKQSLLLREPLDYDDVQGRYHDIVRGLAGDEPVAQSARMEEHGYQISTPSHDEEFPANLLQSSSFRDTWRYNEALEVQPQIPGFGFRPPSGRCMNQQLGQLPFQEPRYKMEDYSDVDALGEDMTSSSTTPKISTPPAMDAWPLLLEEPVSAFHLENGALGADTQDDDEDDEEEEASRDKPYARLIHEALMQAPGHRMMLREIYDWFVQNTTKPSESGTNGWQNSIRHNLSMNQVSLVKNYDKMGKSVLTRRAGF
jgi:Forkhead domain